MSKVNKNEFTCAVCGEIYIKAWTDQEAQEEYETIWGEEAAKDTSIICDDCFVKGLPNVFER